MARQPDRRADASVGRSLQATAPVWAMIQHTDLAMYNTKNAGRRTYRFFEPIMDAHHLGLSFSLGPLRNILGTKVTSYMDLVNSIE